MTRYVLAMLAVLLLAPLTARGGPPAAAAPPGAGAAPFGAPTADELAELRAVEKDFRKYEAAARDYQRTVDHLVKRAYLKKIKDTKDKYEKQIKAEEAALAQRRLEAIKIFEEFLRKHPSHRTHTPNAIFRLAELYYEKAFEEYVAALDDFPKRQEAYAKALESGKKPEELTPVVEPKADYDKVASLYRRLLVEFPDYRQNDATHYLLGYVLTTQEAKTKDEARGRQAFLALLCQNKYKALDEPAPRVRPKSQPKPSEPLGIPDPYADCTPFDAKSRYLPELWTRVGEDHFNVGELVLAIYAFQSVQRLKDHPLYEKYYDKSLYMLAWAHYNLDRFMEDVRLFDTLVIWADKNKGRSKEYEELRPEAITYIAISFAEPWEGDPPGGDPKKALQRFMSFYGNRDQEPHVREVYQKLAEGWFDAGKAGNAEKLEGAIGIYKEMLKRWPTHRDNPRIQDQIITCMVYLRDQKRAIEEREKLAREYAKGTQWYEKNRHDKPAVDDAKRLAEGNMIEAALFHHKKAQDLREKAEAGRDDRLMQQAVESYKIAAEHYTRFLEVYPHSKNFYEYSYSLADTYYFSFQFERAAEQYMKVRDSNLDNKYFEESASGVVLAYEKQIQLQIQKNEIKKDPLPTPETVKPPVQARPVPEVFKRLQAAYDWYTPRFPKSPQNPDRMYEAALISYRALDFPDARKRFETILNKYCKESQVGIDSGNAILNTWIIEDGNTGEKVKQIEEWTNKLAAMQCGAVQGKGYKPDPEITKRLEENKKQIARLQEALLLQKGEAAAKAGKWEEAAQYFEAHIEKYKTSKKRLDSMKNLAICYENLQRFGQATRIYERIFTEYADNNVEAPRAIWLAAAAYDRFFDFERAVTLYRRLADSPRYAAWKDPQKPADMNRNEAILRAADIRERDNSFTEAAQLYRRYADETRMAPTKKTPFALHRAAMQYHNMKNTAGTVTAMNEFLKRFSGDRSAEVSGLAVEAYYRIAEAYESQGRKKDTDQAMARVVNEARARAVKPGSLAAEYAAKAQFKLVEPKYAAFVAYKYTSSDDPKRVQKDLKAINDKMKELQGEYARVIAWNRPEWVTAAGYRSGEMFRLGARKLLDAPPPPKLVKIDQKNPDAGIMGQYTELMQREAAPAEKAAQDQWVKVLEYAAKVPLSNEWTKLSQTRLRDYQPDKYQAVRDEKVEFQLDNPEGR
jgi:tetratricopeptide (TPR) repeat protein